MKKLLLLLLSFIGGIQPLLAETIDTIDHWGVYLNNKKIHEYTMYDKHDIVLKINELKLTDSITVHYASDHPCAKCFIYLEVKSDRQSILLVKAPGPFNALSFSLKALIEQKKKFGKAYFDAFYFEDGVPTQERMQVFRIKLE